MRAAHVLAGYEPDRRGEDALALARVVVRHGGGPLTVASVRPPAWPVPGPGKVDAEWEAFLDAQARDSLRGAAVLLEGIDSPVEYVVGQNRGSGRGLAQLARRHKADLIVIGSAPGGPRRGISVGSTADQLLHGSPVPVVIAPKGYSEVRPDGGFERITVAYLRRPSCEAAVDLAVEVAASRGVPLRLLSVAVGPTAKGRSAVRLAEEAVRRLVDHYETDLALAAKEAGREGSVIETEVVQGPNAARALAVAEWSPGDLLVIASSDSGPIRKVFMGDMSLKILRAAPCPTMVIPRLPIN